MHTSITTLAHAANGTLSASIRVFADDLFDVLRLPTAQASAQPDASSSARIAAYVAERFIVVQSNGRRIALQWCGAKRNGDLLLLCLTAPSIGTLRGATLVNRILVERFTDQVNIVQVQYAGRRQSYLFTRAEAPKRLP